MKKLLLMVMCLFLSAGPLYALSAEVKLDMLKSRLVQELKGGEYGKALNTIADLKATKTKLPKSFAFFEGKALFESGKKAQAYRVMEKYVEANGKEAKYYKQAISYLANSEAAYQAELQAEKKRQAAQRQRQREVEAEQQRVLAEQQAEKSKDDKFREEAAEIARNRKQIYDAATGLAWSAPVYNDGWVDNPYIQYYVSEYEVDSYCSNLVIGEYADWRVPTMKEFSTVYERNKRAKSLNIDWPQKSSYYVWVLGSDDFWGWDGRPYSKNSKYAVSDGLSVLGSRYKKSKVIPVCVRTEADGQLDFFFNHSYTVFSGKGRKIMVEDTFHSRLKSMPNSRDEDHSVPFNIARTANYDSAKSYCSSREIGGYDDWRLPTTADFVDILPCNFEKRLHFPHSGIFSGDIWGINKKGLFAKPIILDVSECKVKYEQKKRHIDHFVRCVRDVK